MSLQGKDHNLYALGHVFVVRLAALDAIIHTILFAVLVFKACKSLLGVSNSAVVFVVMRCKVH